MSLKERCEQALAAIGMINRVDEKGVLDHSNIERWQAQTRFLVEFVQAEVDLARSEDQEPVAWITLSEDGDKVRIWWRDKDRAEKWAAERGLTLVPLYAKPFVAAYFLTSAERSEDGH